MGEKSSKRRVVKKRIRPSRLWTPTIALVDPGRLQLEHLGEVGIRIRRLPPSSPVVRLFVVFFWNVDLGEYGNGGNPPMEWE